MSFAQFELHTQIFKAIETCGYTTPTPVQKKSIPEIMKGKDIVASAQTGTGKTAAFVLPALHRLSTQKPSKKTRILILTPTRELAAQITKSAATYGKWLKFNIVSLVGGMPYHQQIKDLARGADIVVATPGRLLDHIESNRVDLSNIEMLILDEADRMLDMGFIDDVKAIAELTPDDRQTLLFSATVDNKLSSAIKQLLKNPVRIDLSNEKIAAPQIAQELYRATSPQHKLRLLKHFISDEGIYKAIIFTATKINADKLANYLRDEGFAAAALHGDLRQNVRNRTVDQLRRGKIQFLVATDVAARGIDISDVTHVINYDLPKFCEDYVHRIGRTGRAGKSGIAISFVLPSDSRHVQRIERYIGQRLKLISHVNMDATTIDNASEAKTNNNAHKFAEHSLREHHERGFHARRERKSASEGRGFGERRERKTTREDKGFGERRERKSSNEGRSFGERRERKATREDKGFGERRERKATREDKGFGERRERKSSDEGRSFGERRERKATREDKGFGERRERKSSNEGRGFGERRERKATREDKGFGERRERKSASEGKSFGERKFGQQRGKKLTSFHQDKSKTNDDQHGVSNRRHKNDGSRPYKRRVEKE